MERADRAAAARAIGAPDVLIAQIEGYDSPTAREARQAVDRMVGAPAGRDAAAVQACAYALRRLEQAETAVYEASQEVCDPFSLRRALMASLDRLAALEAYLDARDLAGVELASISEMLPPLHFMPAREMLLQEREVALQRVALLDQIERSRARAAAEAAVSQMTTESYGDLPAADRRRLELAYGLEEAPLGDKVYEPRYLASEGYLSDGIETLGLIEDLAA